MAEATAGIPPLRELMQFAVDQYASDLHLTVDAPPVFRINGALRPLDTPVLKAGDTEFFFGELAGDEEIRVVREEGGTDFGYTFGDQARFRVSVFRQRGDLALVLRQIPSRKMTLEEIGLPPQIRDLLFKPRGLILVTGPTGSGKTTTLASMIDIINRERDCHILTVEDPIEYRHEHLRSIVNQRELGRDVPTFSDALRRGLRQDPDVVLLGEMRDLETMAAALTAAETGHLVLATLHTTGAARTVDRIVDAFPSDRQSQIRIQLASSLTAVISQVLLRRADAEGRVAAFEVMISTPSIQALIREKKTFRITSDIQTGAKHGMVEMDASLLKLYREGAIARDDLLAFAQSAGSMKQEIGE
ncbi:type IV pilus twitching motility protein PilT [Kiritimatiella glycovorans]|uniref:Twitching mobility protein n=1 Tax=Kiritimatiella glycovorans TaxID=1307763 RepID=A0A0G3EHA9_9BACT|nr:type IV pilus twitching motility protein PilT [Kiritimatiella glycovorans]AKJ63544.1 Twitching mobility protein [Kiritimatiella glycovorans]